VCETDLLRVDLCTTGIEVWMHGGDEFFVCCSFFSQWRSIEARAKKHEKMSFES